MWREYSSRCYVYYSVQAVLHPGMRFACPTISAGFREVVFMNSNVTTIVAELCPELSVTAVSFGAAKV